MKIRKLWFLLTIFINQSLNAQQLTPAQVEQAKKLLSYAVESYFYNLQNMLDIKQSVEDRQQKYANAFAALFDKPENPNCHVSDFEPQRALGVSYSAFDYAKKMIQSYPEGAKVIWIATNQITEPVWEGGVFQIQIQLTKEIEGYFQKKILHDRQHHLTFYFRFQQASNDSITNFKLLNVGFSLGELQPFEPELVYIPGGEFMMGSQQPEGEDDEWPQHLVKVNSFYMGKYEVTNKEYAFFLNEMGNQTTLGFLWIDLNGEDHGDRCRIEYKNNEYVVQRGYENYPVAFVSWYGAVAYANWLSKKTGKNYRLPTEAEWEYAAGNGSKHTRFSWGDTKPQGKNGGNVADESAKKKFNWSVFIGYDDGYVFAAPVGRYHPNEFGLYDMTGNVWEWCSDWYQWDYYKISPYDNPKGAASGTSRVKRGASFHNAAMVCRVANRGSNPPNYTNHNLGFRLVLEP
ncbi:MAG: formylglycine-generating enzyme family protein [Cytophagales bacterium]|nr:formylglycine-generating enzyme family protein [Cytophagales bacterium]MDW8383859.1 formylglycine-generating enzyme family protein [Flammeovirgaceae bacterium]